MSGIYLLVLIAVWLFVGWFIYRLWRRWQPVDLAWKILHFGIAALLFSVWFGGAFWMVAGKKMYYDAEVRELCAKDGGVKVYETVVLRPALVDKFGRITIPDKSKVKPADEYYYESETYSYRKGSVEISQDQYQIVRRSDGKILGKSIFYSRGGGNLPGPWHGSSFICPDPTTAQGLENAIFVRRDKK